MQFAVGLLDHCRDVSQRSLVSGHLLEVLSALCFNCNANPISNQPIRIIQINPFIPVSSAFVTNQPPIIIIIIIIIMIIIMIIIIIIIMKSVG